MIKISPDDVKEESEFSSEINPPVDECKSEFDSPNCEPIKKIKRGPYNKFKNYNVVVPEDLLQEVEARISNFESKMMNNFTDPEHKKLLSKQILHEKARAEFLR